MNPEERSLLERTYKMTEENNEILLSMRRSRRFGLVFKSIYWIVIIGLSVGALYFIQPYIDFMKSTLGIGQANSASTENTSASQNYLETLQDLLK